MDIRIEKTKTAIHNTFLELRSRKPLEKITIKELCEKALELIRSLGAPLGMLQKQTKKESLEDEIERLIEQRQEARKNRDFALADKIRDDLKVRGIVLIDTPQGVRWKKEN